MNTHNGNAASIAYIFETLGQSKTKNVKKDEYFCIMYDHFLIQQGSYLDKHECLKSKLFLSSFILFRELKAFASQRENVFLSFFIIGSNFGKNKVIRTVHHGWGQMKI